MEITIQKANGAPMSELETAALLRYLHDRLMPLIEVKDDDCPSFEPDNFTYNLKIFFKEDNSYVYAAAFCPGISKDRLEVQIDSCELLIRTKPADPNGEKDDFICGDSPWKCFENLSYAGKSELPNEVIAEKATAELSHGILFIKLPKTEAVKPKTVAVK